MLERLPATIELAVAALALALLIGIPAGIYSAFDRDPSAVAIDDRFRDRETEAGARLLAAGGVETLEALEETSMVARPDADAPVADGDRELVGVARHAHQHAAARRGELHRVRHQVRQHLDQAVAIAGDERQIGIELAADRDVASGRVRAQARDRLLDQRPRRDGRERQIHFSELELRNVENVVDEADQPVGVLQADHEELALDRRQGRRLAEDELQRSLDRRERRA